MSHWRDGEVLAGRAAELAADRGFLLGDGVFETVLVCDGEAPLLARHLARLQSSAHALDVPCPPDLDVRVAAALRALLDAEERPLRAALRVSLSRGSGRGLEPAPDAVPGLCVALDALAPRPRGALGPPARAVVVEDVRVDPYDARSGHKTLSALHWVLARREARRRGADVGLVRTIEGDVCEADCANVFAVLDGVVVTPPLDRGVLPGITRARALSSLDAAGRPVRLARLDSASLGACEEAFLTSSLDLVRPVVELDGAALPGPGPVAAWLAGCL